MTKNKIAKVRAKISGTSSRPRLAVFKSLKYITAQLIDDEKGATIVAARGTKAEEVGKAIAKKASEKKIKEAVFDRRTYKYHGKVKALADAARDGGLSI